MTKAKETPTAAAPPSDAATVEDVAIAAALIPANSRTRDKPLTSKWVSLFVTPGMQAKLLGLSPQLAAYGGCEVENGIKLANEGAVLIAAHERLENSKGRTRQRVVEINKRLQNLVTSLGRAYRAAPPGSDVAKGLAGLAGLRAAELATTKAKKTKKKRKAKKAAGTKP